MSQQKILNKFRYRIVEIDDDEYTRETYIFQQNK